MEADALIADADTLIRKLRAAVDANGRLGPIPHALNCAASHVQDALGQLYIVREGGSPAVTSPISGGSGGSSPTKARFS